MKTIKPKRVTIEVVWSKANQSWQVRGKNRLILASRDNKPDAIAAAITICERRESAELIIKNKNGTIGKGGSAKRSYPRASDPKGSRG